MSIHHLIAAINPDLFCEPSARREVKQILRAMKPSGDRPDYPGAAGRALPVEPNRIGVESLELENPFRLPGIKSPTERHTLIYDSLDESLEAFYFWLLDELTADSWTASKLADTFSASPASGLFSDLTRRESQAQREALRLLRDAHALARDILRTAAFLKAEAESGEADEKNVKPNQQIERSLLKSKVESLKLYARWLGPYLRQARQTKQGDLGGPALINLFNTATAEVTLLAQKEYPVAEEVDGGDLPTMFLKARRREFFSVLIVELKLRAAPERTSPGAYGYRGRFDLTLTSYALNSDELAVLRRELDRENLDEVLRSLWDGSASTLNDLVKEIDALLAEPEKTVTATSDPNPFAALLDFSAWFGSDKSAKSPHQDSPLKPDSEIEEVIRSQSLLAARRAGLDFYRRCKKALKMPSF